MATKNTVYIAFSCGKGFSFGNKGLRRTWSTCNFAQFLPVPFTVEVEFRWNSYVVFEAVLFAGSQTKLAETLGVTRQSVQEWVKRGYVPNVRVREIEKLYGISRERLCDPKFLELVCGKDDSEE